MTFNFHLNELLRHLAEQDADASGAAWVTLLDWLRWNRGRYEQPSNPQFATLTSDEMDATVDAIFSTFAEHPERGHVLSLLAETPSERALERLLKLMTSEWSRFDDHALHQAFVALQDLLEYDDGEPLPTTQSLVKRYDPRPHLGACLESPDPSVRAISRQVLEAIGRYLAVGRTSG